MVNHRNGDSIINQEDGRKSPSTISTGGGGATRSWGPTISGQSVSTSGSVGSPSSRSETAMATPASDSTFVRLNNLEIQGDDAGSQEPAGKKKKGQRAVGGDKSGRGLRQFSMKVCEKVESKGRTTYNEVADELVAEFTDPNNNLATPNKQQYDEKNIRRRVYDALNVLMAMDIISKDRKEIQWKGLPRTSSNDIEELKTECIRLGNRNEKKAAYLDELKEQYVGLQNLIQRNKKLYGSGDAPRYVYMVMVSKGFDSRVLQYKDDIHSCAVFACMYVESILGEAFLNKPSDRVIKEYTRKMTLAFFAKNVVEDVYCSWL